MRAELLDADREAERAYWQARLKHLELLLCELLIKNERLRRESEASGSWQSDEGTAPLNF